MTLTPMRIGLAHECLSAFNRRLVDHIQSLEDELGRKPGWSDFEMMDLYGMAHSMVVRDVLDGGRDYRIRFWGTRMTEALEFEATGKTLRDFRPPEMTKIVRARYDEMVSTGRSWVVAGKLRYVPNKSYQTFEVVHLPLFDSAEEVSHIVSSYDWNFADGSS